MTESTIIELIAKKLNCNARQNGMGNFGDDAYTVPSCHSSEMIVHSTDSFVEGTHFTRAMGFYAVGWKSLVSALSDIYAMGASPSFYSLSLIVPEDIEGKDLESFTVGLQEASERHNVKLLGGDVAKGGVFCAVVHASGYQRKEYIKTNSGFAVGDVILTDAKLGHALLGLEEFQKGVGESDFITEFLHPLISLELGPWLSSFESVTSLTDVSDGLHKELENMCKLKECSIAIEHLPINSSFINACGKLQLNPEIIALQGGEEYGLLWTVEPSELQEFLKRYQMKFKRKPHILGRVEGPHRIKKISYENQDLIESIKPFEHFTS